MRDVGQFVGRNHAVDDGRVPAGFAAPIVGPTTTQAFWQFMTCVSQATKHTVDVCDDMQGSRSQRDWLDQSWGITHNQNA
jgi:hypothetical protein